MRTQPDKADLVVTNDRGRTFNVVVEPDTKGKGDPTIAFYDATYADTPEQKKGFGPMGQFTGASYYASTLAEHTPGAGLTLDGGSDVWSIDGKAFAPVVELAKRELDKARGIEAGSQRSVDGSKPDLVINNHHGRMFNVVVEPGQPHGNPPVIHFFDTGLRDDRTAPKFTGGSYHVTQLVGLKAGDDLVWDQLDLEADGTPKASIDGAALGLIVALAKREEAKWRGAAPAVAPIQIGTTNLTEALRLERSSLVLFVYCESKASIVYARDEAEFSQYMGLPGATHLVMEYGHLFPSGKKPGIHRFDSISDWREFAAERGNQVEYAKEWGVDLSKIEVMHVSQRSPEEHIRAQQVEQLPMLASLASAGDAKQLHGFCETLALVSGHMANAEKSGRISMDEPGQLVRRSVQYACEFEKLHAATDWPHSKVGYFEAISAFMEEQFVQLGSARPEQAMSSQERAGAAPTVAAVDPAMPDKSLPNMTGLQTPPTGYAWSNPSPVPPIGTNVHITLNKLGEGTVKSYFTEGGYLGVEVSLKQQPEWHLKQNGKGATAHLFGAELQYSLAAPKAADPHAAYLEELAGKYGTRPEVIQQAQTAFHGGGGSDLLPGSCTLQDSIRYFTERERIIDLIQKNGVKAQNGLAYAWDEKTARIYSYPQGEPSLRHEHMALDRTLEFSEHSAQSLLQYPTSVEVNEIISALRPSSDSLAFQMHAEKLMGIARSADSARALPYGVRSEDLATRKSNSDFNSYYAAYARVAIANEMPPLTFDLSEQEALAEIRSFYEDGSSVGEMVSAHLNYFASKGERETAFRDFLAEESETSDKLVTPQQLVAREYPATPFVAQPSQTLLPVLEQLTKEYMVLSDEHYERTHVNYGGSGVLYAAQDAIATVKGVSRQELVGECAQETALARNSSKKQPASKGRKL